MEAAWQKLETSQLHDACSAADSDSLHSHAGDQRACVRRLRYLAVGNHSVEDSSSRDALSFDGLAAVARALSRQPHYAYMSAHVFTYVHDGASFGCEANRATAACFNCCDWLQDLRALCELADLPMNTSFFVHMGDARLGYGDGTWPASLPVVSKVRWVGGPGVLLPVQFGPHWQRPWWRADTASAQTVPWEQKRGDRLFWRGGTGGMISGSLHRQRFVRRLRQQGHDVHFSEFTIDGNALENVQEGVLAIGGATHVREPSTGRIIGAKRLSDNETFITREDVRDNETVTGREQSRNFKYLLILEGNDIASSLKWALGSDSLVVMPRPTTESWLMEGALKPYVHYAPLDDPEHAADLLRWLQAHDRQARRMVLNANTYVKRFRLGGRRCSRASTVPMECIIKPAWARVLLGHAAAAWSALKEAADKRADGDT